MAGEISRENKILGPSHTTCLIHDTPCMHEILTPSRQCGLDKPLNLLNTSSIQCNLATIHHVQRPGHAKQNDLCACPLLIALYKVRILKYCSRVKRKCSEGWDPAWMLISRWMSNVRSLILSLPQMDALCHQLSHANDHSRTYIIRTRVESETNACLLRE